MIVAVDQSWRCLVNNLRVDMHSCTCAYAKWPSIIMGIIGGFYRQCIKGCWSGIIHQHTNRHQILACTSESFCASYYKSETAPFGRTLAKADIRVNIQRASWYPMATYIVRYVWLAEKGQSVTLLGHHTYAPWNSQFVTMVTMKIVPTSSGNTGNVCTADTECSCTDTPT